MTLKKGKRVNEGGFLDLLELVEDGPISAVFRIVEFAPEEKGDFGPLLPVVADVLICSGPREGEVHLSERFIGAPTAALRGVKNPKSREPIEAPVTEIGDELMFRIEIGKAFGKEFAALNVPSDAECDAMAKVHDDGKAWNVAPANGSAPVPTTENGAKKRPW